MSEMKYTKGPWEHWAGNATMSVTGPAAAASMCAVRAIKEQGYGYCVELASIGQETPGIALGDTQERAEANARLIAAAPDLFDSHEPDREGPDFLDWVASRLVLHGDHPQADFIVCLRRRAEKARAAIAKATGQA